ncbi:hypothetical protein MMC07_001741 [Pseudocyphellaria aurata]|nr:hypothetical protein [Pseudocyphellaria aurata]
MPLGKLLAELADDEVPFAEAHEIIKMKIIAGPWREDMLKGVRDWDDVRDLINSGAKVLYDDAEDKSESPETHSQNMSTPKTSFEEVETMYNDAWVTKPFTKAPAIELIITRCGKPWRRICK